MVSASAGTGGALSSAVAQDQADDDGWDAEGVDVPQSPAAAPGGNIYRGGQQQHGASATSSATGSTVGAVGGTGNHLTAMALSQLFGLCPVYLSGVFSGHFAHHRRCRLVGVCV